MWAHYQSADHYGTWTLGGGGGGGFTLELHLYVQSVQGEGGGIRVEVGRGGRVESWEDL